MDSDLCQKRINVNDDRLSSLPDDLIYKVLCSFDIKHVIETSVLSSRWRYIWTSMPYLNFLREGFSPPYPELSRFVTQVLSHRNNETNVSSVKLSVCGSISRVFDTPLCLFSSHFLQDLTLIGFTIIHSITPTSTWELPALKTLHLDHVRLYGDARDNFSGLLSNCKNLKNLILKESCIINEVDGLSICHPQLSNLRLENNVNFYNDVSKVVKVVTPQLKNLSIILNCCCPRFKFDCLPSLDKVDLCMAYKADAPRILGLLQQFNCVKFLTLNLEFIEALSSSRELISN